MPQLKHNIVTYTETYDISKLRIAYLDIGLTINRQKADTSGKQTTSICF